MANLLNCVCFLFPQQAKHTVTFKQLPTTTQTLGHKPNLPLIRNPTKTIQIPQDFVKKLLCSETLDVTGEESSEDSKTEVSVDGKTIFISTKPVKPAAALQKGNSSQPLTNHSVEQVPQKSKTVVGVVSNNLFPKKTENSTDSCSIQKDSLVVSEESSSALKTSAPESPPFHPISPVEIRESPSVQRESLSQASSLPIPLSPYLQLCQGSSRGTSPLLSRCSSLVSVSEPDRMYGTDSQVSAQCRSKSVSPNVLVVQNGVGGCQHQSPVITSTPVQPIISSSSLSSSVAGPSNIPNSCIQTSLITTGVAAAVGAPVRLGVPLPVTRVTVAPPQVALVPGISTQSTVGQFMPISSVLPPHPARPLPMPSSLYNPMQPCISTAIPTTNHIPTTATHHVPPPPYTSTPAGLITPTTGSQQPTNDINFYRTPTTLPLGSIQPKAFPCGQALGVPTPYVLSGVGGSIGQLQPVSRRLTLTLPPFSQN